MFFSNLFGEEGPRIPGVKDWSVPPLRAGFPVRMLPILYSSPRPLLKGRYFRGAIRSSVCFIEILSALLTFFRFLPCLFLLYPIHLFQWSLNPRLIIYRFPVHKQNHNFLSVKLDRILLHLGILLLFYISLNRVRMTFTRHSTLCNSLAFHLNPWILDPLNPLEPHRLTWRLFTWLALISYN